MVRVKLDGRRSHSPVPPCGSRDSDDEDSDPVFVPSSGSERDPIVIDSSSDEEERKKQQQTRKAKRRRLVSSDSENEEETPPPRRKRLIPAQTAFKRKEWYQPSQKIVERAARRHQANPSSSADEDDHPPNEAPPFESVVPAKRRRSGGSTGSSSLGVPFYHDVPVIDLTMDSGEDCPEEDENEDAKPDVSGSDRSVTETCRPEPVRQNRRKDRLPVKKAPIRQQHVVREIRRLQLTSKLQIPRVAFARVCKEISENIANGFCLLDAPPSWQSLALSILQTAAEDYLTVLFEDCNCAAVHARRATIMPRDLAFVARMRGVADPGFRYCTAPK